MYDGHPGGSLVVLVIRHHVNTMEAKREMACSVEKDGYEADEVWDSKLKVSLLPRAQTRIVTSVEKDGASMELLKRKLLFQLCSARKTTQISCAPL